MDLGPGDKVICIHAEAPDYSESLREYRLVKNAVYTIATIISVPGRCGFCGARDQSDYLRLAEIDGGFCPKRFKPLRGSFDYLLEKVDDRYLVKVDAPYLEDA